MTRVYYDEDVPTGALADETVAVLGYGIQGRAQALNLRDSRVSVVVGNRPDRYADRALEEGFDVMDLDEATARGTTVLILLPDEVQSRAYTEFIHPSIRTGSALVFAHGFAVHYGFVEPPEDVDLLLLAPRMPGQYVRCRYVEGWGVPALVGVEHDATGRALTRLLGLAGALGFTRCAAIETTFAQETELDHFSEHFTYPLILSTLELAFRTLVNAGYPPEVALLELHGSGELGEVLRAAAREGLYGMIASHASPACQVGIARHWDEAVGSAEEVEGRMRAVLRRIRSGAFARYLTAEQSHGYPDWERWRAARPAALETAERTLRGWLRGPPGARAQVPSQGGC